MAAGSAAAQCFWAWGCVDHAERICGRESAISRPGTMSRHSADLSMSAETFGGTAYVATVLSPALLDRVNVIVPRLPSQLTSAVG
jgi:hypothetical protein